MPQRCKDLFELSMSSDISIEDKEWSDEEKEFLFDENGKQIVRTLNDFKMGLKVPGKLRPKRIRGGILLVETTYEMR